ncbi:hypothetical protein ALC56_04581, partial [Trachymyrmex septentrionalis]
TLRKLIRIRNRTLSKYISFLNSSLHKYSSRDFWRNLAFLGGYSSFPLLSSPIIFLILINDYFMINDY